MKKSKRIFDTNGSLSISALIGFNFFKSKSVDCEIFTINPIRLRLPNGIRTRHPGINNSVESDLMNSSGIT